MSTVPGISSVALLKCGNEHLLDFQLKRLLICIMRYPIPLIYPLVTTIIQLVIKRVMEDNGMPVSVKETRNEALNDTAFSVYIFVGVLCSTGNTRIEK